MKLPRISDYPKELRIGDETYRVKFVPTMRYRTKRGGHRINYGVCYPDTREIHISRGVGRELAFKTFLHEVLHAFEYEYDLPIKHSLVYLLEDPLARFFLDNF